MPAATASDSPDRDTDSMIFDLQALSQRLNQDDELIRTVIHGFLNDLPIQMEALRQALDAGDAEWLGRRLHNLKGASATVSAESMREMILEMEKAVREGDMSDLRSRFLLLQSELPFLRAAMEKALSDPVEN